MNAAESQGLGELRPIVPLPQLDFDHLTLDVPLAPVEIGGDRGTLSVDAEAAGALLGRADPEVGDELAVRYGPPRPLNNAYRSYGYL